jgi:hypothetical protein
MSETPSTCVFCARDSQVVPLITAEFKGQSFRICSQHLPVLIHDPSQLAGKLSGAEKLAPSDYHD